MTSSTKSSTIRKIWHLLDFPERRSAMILLGLMTMGMVLETLGVGLVIPALALLAQSDIGHKYPTLRPILEALGNPTRPSLVIGGMLILVGTYLIKAIFLALLTWWQTRFAFGVQAQLSQRLFTLYLRQPYTFHLQRNSAQLIRNLINDVTVFTFHGMLPALTLVTESLVLVGVCSLLVVIEPLGALMVVSVLGAAGWGFHHFTRERISRSGDARQYHDGMRIQYLQEGLSAAKDVILLGRETNFLDQYRTHNFESARAAELQSTLQQFPRLWLEFLAVTGLAILVISMLAQGRDLESVLPTLGLFGAAAFRLIPSVNRVLGTVQALRYGLPVIDTLLCDLQLTPLSEQGASHDPGPFHTVLELNNVNYAYPAASKCALKDLTLSIRRGESVGFIGTSGAGKSTVVDIMLGLLTPDQGTVRVDGNNIQSNLRQWQDQIGYVPQSIFLTDDTLRRNVAFGLSDEEIDDAAVVRAITAAQLDEYVRSLPGGLETVVGERGVNISGGQRQRIGIARALYHDPSVLVLDEATSALDTTTEESVMQSIIALHGRKTIIVIAHRLSTVAHCDRVYRLRDGEIVNENAHPTALLAPAAY